MPDEEIKEPSNSTVNDWFGQNVARDAEIADAVTEEEQDEESAEQRFAETAKGRQRYEEGHPRP